MTERELRWLCFSVAVVDHLNNYVEPQYKDPQNDCASDYTVEDCMKQIERYAKRQGKNSRPNQDRLDLLKIAHWAQIAWEKLPDDTETA